MRTTLDLDADVASQLTTQAREDGCSLSRVANDLLRGDLLSQQLPVALASYDPPVVETGRPLIP